MIKKIKAFSEIDLYINANYKNARATIDKDNFEIDYKIPIGPGTLQLKISKVFENTIKINWQLLFDGKFISANFVYFEDLNKFAIKEFSKRFYKILKEIKEELNKFINGLCKINQNLSL